MKKRSMGRGPGRLAAIFALALITWALSPAAAARPPEGRTYYTVALGIGDPYDAQGECFEFQPSRLCSLDGRICGTWERDERSWVVVDSKRRHRSLNR